MTRLNLRNLPELLEPAVYATNVSKLLQTDLKVSRRQLQRYTQKVFGKSPHQWLRGERMLRAKSLLIQERSVKVVAFQLGFKQISHFSREFKRSHGLSPTEFLARHDAAARSVAVSKNRRRQR